MKHPEQDVVTEIALKNVVLGSEMGYLMKNDSHKELIRAV